MATTHQQLTSREYQDVAIQLIVNPQGDPVTNGPALQIWTATGEHIWFISPGDGTPDKTEWQPERWNEPESALYLSQEGLY